MATHDPPKHLRPVRKLTKKKREPGRISMDVPERFRYGDDDAQEEEEEAAKIGTAVMHQSIFGAIAAAQSRDDFQSILEQSGSESGEDGDEDPEIHRGPSGASKSTTKADFLPSKPTSKKKLSEHKLLKSLPGLRSRKTRDAAASAGPVSTNRSPLSRSSQQRSPSPNTLSPSRDAPIMSQMLQARAMAEDIDSSNATLRSNRSGDESPSLRKAPLALPDALKNIFQFDEPEEVISEYPCWFLQSVLLQGYMYITQRHVCFYAYLQKKTNVTIKSGYLAKRGKTNPHYRRYWFSLKGSVLSYFTDPSTPYYPRGHVDLRYGISADLVKDKDKLKDDTYFSVTTDKRTYNFKADSAMSAKEWVKQLQKVIFRSHNDGDSVKISLPIDNILDVEENPVIDFAETIKIRVIDNDETYAVDEYFFSFFSSGKDVLNVLQIMTQDTNAAKAFIAGRETTDTKPVDQKVRAASKSPRASVTLIVPAINDHVRATISPAPASGKSSPRLSMDMSRSSLDIPRRSSSSRPRASFDNPRRSVSAASRVSFDHIRPRGRSPLYTPPTGRKSSLAFSPDLGSPSPDLGPDSPTDSDASASRILSESVVFNEPTLRSRQPHRVATKPHVDRTSQLRVEGQEIPDPSGQDRAVFSEPEAMISEKATDRSGPSSKGNVGPERKSSYSEQFGGIMRAGAYPMQRATDIAGLIKVHGKRVSNLLGTSPMGYYEKVYGMWAGGKKHYSDSEGLQSEDHVYDPDEESDTIQAEMRFREYFALPDSERLVASFFGHILRVLPLYGKIYIGSTRVCFRSLLPGTRTKLVIPFKDILNVDKEKGFRFGYSGMVVVIRGHEEVFFEFHSAGLRDDCTITILRALDSIKGPQEFVLSEAEKAIADEAANENMVLQEARQDDHAKQDLQIPRNIGNLEPGAPAMLFDDPEASVLDFKPQDPLRITCLTIGSRGDVQPYIALCKGFLKEGHKVKIATHAEFEPWVRKHGIDFAAVEGDPAELMQICVENGMFTPSFLYEANSKFRGFIDTLLTTAWTACQDSDLLIESPSAMAGIHIAEALSIPYFRAFTMPWTRTRAYPHAFAVPNHKMGGAYNYMTYVLFDNVFWQATAGQINRWRRKVLGLRPTTLDKLQPNKVPFLYNFSPSVVVPPLDFSDWIRVTGYWFLDEAPVWTPPDPLLEFIKKARADKMPLVYIGFGSVVVSDSKAMTQNIIAAVQKADVRCILSKGWSDRLDKTDAKVVEVPLPSSILQISSAPHDWLFAQIDAAVHHGGAGTTGASLRAGVPTIIKPFFGDQFFFGNRVQDLGVGLCIKRVSENTLGKALWIASHDSRMRDKARLLGEQIRSERGVENAIKAVYRDMEYAKTLVKKRDPLAVGAAAPGGGGGVGGGAVEGEVGAEGDLDDEAEGQEESWTFVEGDSETEVREMQRSMELWQGQRQSLGRGRAERGEKGGQRKRSLGNVAMRGSTRADMR